MDDTAYKLASVCPCMHKVTFPFHYTLLCTRVYIQRYEKRLWNQGRVDLNGGDKFSLSVTHFRAIISVTLYTLKSRVGQYEDKYSIERQ